MSKRSNAQIIDIAEKWFKSKGWKVFDFQKKTWKAYLNGKSGLLNAPTGSGKTYALWIPAALEFLKEKDSFEVKP
ncbi:MAG: DEAD/DEAH box helicase, partial [Bacteroidota bacterium]